MADIMTTLIEEKNRQIADYRGLLELANARNDLLQKEIDDLMQLLKYPDSYDEWREKHKPKILEIEQLEDWMDAVWFEDKEEGMCFAALIANTSSFDVTIVHTEPGLPTRCDWLNEFYGIDWRCWSTRPTDEQRKAEPWKDGEQE